MLMEEDVTVQKKRTSRPFYTLIITVLGQPHFLFQSWLPITQP